MTPREAKEKYHATHYETMKDGVTPQMYYRIEHVLYNDDTIEKRWVYLSFCNIWTGSRKSLETGRNQLKEIQQ